MAHLPNDTQIAVELERVLIQLIAETEAAVRKGADLPSWAPEQLEEARGRIWTLMQMYHRLHAGDATDQVPEKPRG